MRNNHKKTQTDCLLVNQKYIALVLGVSPTTIVNWKDIPSQKVGRERLYFIPDVVRWFMEKERVKLSSLSEEQSLYTRTRRERQELLLQKERGEVFPLEDGKRLITMLALNAKGHLEAMTNRLPTRLAAESDWRKIKAMLKKEVATVLSMFAKMKFE